MDTLANYARAPSGCVAVPADPEGDFILDNADNIAVMDAAFAELDPVIRQGFWRLLKDDPIAALHWMVRDDGQSETYLRECLERHGLAWCEANYGEGHG